MGNLYKVICYFLLLKYRIWLMSSDLRGSRSDVNWNVDFVDTDWKRPDGHLTITFINICHSNNFFALILRDHGLFKCFTPCTRLKLLMSSEHSPVLSGDWSWLRYALNNLREQVVKGWSFWVASIAQYYQGIEVG